MGGSWSSDEIPGGGTEGYHVLRVKTVTREKKLEVHTSYTCTCYDAYAEFRNGYCFYQKHKIKKNSRFGNKYTRRYTTFFFFTDEKLIECRPTLFSQLKFVICKPIMDLLTDENCSNRLFIRKIQLNSL